MEPGSGQAADSGAGWKNASHAVLCPYPAKSWCQKCCRQGQEWGCGQRCWVPQCISLPCALPVGLVSRGEQSWAEFALVCLRASTNHRERNTHGRQMKIRIEWCLKEG